MAYTRALVLVAIFTLCQACSLSDHPVAQSKLGKPSSLEALVWEVLGPDQTHIGRAIGQEWHGSWLDNFGHFEGKSWRDCVELMSESFHEAARAVLTIQAAFTG